MLKVHETGIKYYNKNNICVARESERTRARNRKRKRKRKRKPFAVNLYNARERKGVRPSGRGGDG